MGTKCRVGLEVFPARAGMSPAEQKKKEEEESVPRASGDEPWAFRAGAFSTACSPRERG